MKTINVLGNYVNNLTGYGIHIKNLFENLQKFENANLKIIFTDIFSDSSITENISKSNENFINILISSGNTASFLDLFNGKKIIYTVFESDKLPDDWIEPMNKVDEVWTASQWGKDVMINSGIVNNIKVIPEGVNHYIFNPSVGTIPDLTLSNKFKFLMVGKYEDRKGYTEALTAFKNVYGNNPDFQLVIKADHFSNPSANENFINTIKKMELNNVRIIKGKISEYQMAMLYKSCDCFLFPTRAEGWGLPLIEAISTGIPVITTYYSGQTEFLRDIRNLFLEVDFNINRIDSEDYKKWGFIYNDNNFGNWCNPKVESIEKAIKEVVNDSEKWNKKALEAAKIISNKYNWINSCNEIIFATI